MAVIYLFARSLDHRAGPWHAFAVAGLLMVGARPLDVRDAGFLLTFGATAALLEVARRLRRFAEGRSRWRWVVGVVAASLAAEVALLPIAAASFSRITLAGLVLNIVAVPVMGLVQVAGLAVLAAHALAPNLAAAAGWVAHAGATTLLESARLVDIAPWLTWRVPPPEPILVAGYYGSLGVVLLARSRGPRVVAGFLWGAAWLAIASGFAVFPATTRASERLVRLTMFDVGQGESMLLELPDGSRTLVDTGGAPFGSGTFDIGGRVLAPALWARGVRSLDGLLVTHGDPDHLGGALSVIDAFDPRHLLEGIVVPRHEPSQEVRVAAMGGGAAAVVLRAGMTWRAGGARIRVLHPPEPDWERPRVRNDDSVVVEIVYGTVAILLTGDISGGVERAILPQLTASPVRVLKVGHHGSRTSTSRELLEAWRPHYALVSAGRGNRFGHPTKEVINRLEAVHARIYRTDTDGQITLTTDGRSVEVTTFTGEKQ
jgi:competence protein ComEC